MSDPFASTNMQTINMAGVSVMLGIPAGRDFDALTVKSLVQTFISAQQRGVSVQLGMVAHCAVIQWARDEVIDLFLQSDCTTLFWIDSDMVWEPGQFLRLVIWSQLYDVVCAAYPAKQDATTFFMLRDEKEVANGHGLMEIEGTGLGFVVMRRAVVEKLAKASTTLRDQISGRDIPSVFRVDGVGGNRRGEDMAFFADIRAAGYKVMLDPTVDLGHIGRKVYTGSIRDALN